MEVNEATSVLRSSLPGESLVGVDNVVNSMASVRGKLHAADLAHYEPFAFVYHGVTEDVQDRLSYGKMFRELRPFQQPHVLHRATGKFWYHGAKQLIESEEHWKPLLDDERARHVDKGTQLWLGMIAHIGGDLARTVYEAEATPEYVRYDYPLINRLLEHRAHKVSEYFVPVSNDTVRHTITDTAMFAIKAGRRYAIHDYHRMRKAKSDDERESIIDRSHVRTAKVASAFLALSYKLNNSSSISSRFTALDIPQKVA